jgi:hypothetical protein
VVGSPKVEQAPIARSFAIDKSRDRIEPASQEGEKGKRRHSAARFFPEARKL